MLVLCYNLMYKIRKRVVHRMFTYTKILLLFVTVLLIRPTAFGQQYTTYGIILALLALGMHLIESLKANNNFKIPRKNFIVITTAILMWTFLLAQASLVGSNHLVFAMKACVAHLIILISCGIILSHNKSNYLFFRGLLKIFIFFSFSYLVTFVITMFLGVNYSKLFLFSIPVEGYTSGVGNIYFPFTQLYGFMTVGNLELPRDLGLFRESGIFQAFLIWAFFNLEQYNLDKKIFKFILFIGVIGTFSTAGIAVFFAVYAIKLFVNKRKILSTILITISILGLFYAPYVGLKSKSITHSTSITDRTYAITTGLHGLLQNPLGTGLYNAGQDDVANSGINLLAMSNQLGFIGLALVLMVYFLPLFGYKNKRNYLIGVIPFFITLLISEPILDAPFIYIMMFANYGNAYERELVQKSLNKLKKMKFKRYRFTLRKSHI